MLISGNLVYYLCERSNFPVIANMRNAVFWYVVAFILIGKYQHFRGTCHFLLLGRRCQLQVTPKWHVSTSLHHIASQKTAIVMVCSL
jgi:hypothetical protein